jgi:hypothetical protein
MARLVQFKLLRLGGGGSMRKVNIQETFLHGINSHECCLRMFLGTTTQVLGLCSELIRLDLMRLEFCTFSSFSVLFIFYFPKI